MRHNAVVLLLFLVFFRLSSLNAYKLIGDKVQEVEDPEWNQVIGNFTNFWPRSYIVVLRMPFFFQVTSTFSKFYLDFSISFLFGSSISLFFLDFHFPFYFCLDSYFDTISYQIGSVLLQFYRGIYSKFIIKVWKYFDGHR